MLRIETFDNKSGGNAFFKAVTHPLAAAAAPELLRRLGEGRCAVYDVEGQIDALAELYDLSRLKLAGSFVQDVTAVGRPVLGSAAQPVTALEYSRASIVFVAGFDAERATVHIRHLLPPGATVVEPRRVAFARKHRADGAPLSRSAQFRDQFRLLPRAAWLVDASRHGELLVRLRHARADSCGCSCSTRAAKPSPNGPKKSRPAATSIVIDSRAVRAAFRSARIHRPAFRACDRRGRPRRGQIRARHLSAEAIAERAFSCTHDANSWPADLYAGLPAPERGRAGDALGPEQPALHDPGRRDRTQSDGRR